MNCLEPAPSSAGQPKEDHGAVLLFLDQVVLQGHGSGIAPRAQQIVAAAVPGAPLPDRLLDRAARLLAQAGQGVVLRPESHRLAAAGGKGGSQKRWEYRVPSSISEALLLQGGS